MNCPQCGAPLPEGAKFCGRCGAQITVPAQKPAPYKMEMPAAVQPDLGAAAKKASRPKWLVPGIAAVLVVLVVLFFVFGRSSSGGILGSDAYILLQDGKYKLLTDLSKEDLLEIASAKSDAESERLVQFSLDGKYIYYFTKYDADNSTGTLCRAEYGKLKAGSPKNDQYVTTIASNVDRFLYVTKNGILYQNESSLYYYDGSESIRLTKDISALWVNDTAEDKALYSADYEDGGSSLYLVSLEDPKNPQKIDKGVARVVTYGSPMWADLNDFTYYKETENDRYALYRAGINREPEKITGNILNFTSDPENKKLFYFKDTGKTVSLYDFVSDPYRSSGEYAGMRKELQNSDNDLPITDLYCYENGQETLIAENVLSNRWSYGGFVFWKADTFRGKVNIDALQDYSDVEYSLKYLEYENVVEALEPEEFFLYSDASGSVVSATGSAAEILAAGEIRIAGEQVFVKGEDLQMAMMENGTLGNFRLLADDGSPCLLSGNTSGDTFYYVANIYQQGDTQYADLYQCKNGESTCLARDTDATMAYVYEDGQICLNRGNGAVRVSTVSNTEPSELTLIDSDGTSQTIAEDATQYVKFGKNDLLYLSDGDLYYYDGKDKTRVISDVDGIWAQEAVPWVTMVYLKAVY